MQIKYKNKKIEKVCTDAYEAEKKYGSKIAEKIHQRIDELSAADSVETMIKYHIGRCHSLSGNRKNQYALDLGHPHRLVFTKEETSDGNTVIVIEIVDYH